MLTDRQTHRRTDGRVEHNTLHPYRGEVTRPVLRTLRIKIARPRCVFTLTWVQVRVCVYIPGLWWTHKSNSYEWCVHCHTYKSINGTRTNVARTSWIYRQLRLVHNSYECEQLPLDCSHRTGFFVAMNSYTSSRTRTRVNVNAPSTWASIAFSRQF